VRNKGRIIEKDAKQYRVKEGNYVGSSKGMEGHCLVTFIDWAEKTSILGMFLFASCLESEPYSLGLIKVSCCDKDSTCHKILREDPRCSKIEVVLDPGHYKKCFQNSLIKLFGKSKQYDSFASPLANWFMRCLAESKSIFLQDREKLIAEFTRRFNFMWSHYTEEMCEEDCPCFTFHVVAVPDCLKIATRESILSQLFDVKYACETFFDLVDSKTIAAMSCVCKHWSRLAESMLISIENRTHKKLLPHVGEKAEKKLDCLKVLLSDVLRDVRSYCHYYNTCYVESSHNACLAFGEKRINYYSSFEGRTYCSYSKQCLGIIFGLYSLLS
jgi:hypothetical protein